MKASVAIKESVYLGDGGELADAAYQSLVGISDMLRTSDNRGKFIVWNDYGDSKQTTRKSDRMNDRTLCQYDVFLRGLYYPGSKRSYWVGNFDVGVDPFPNDGCVYCQPGEHAVLSYATIARLKRLPVDVFADVRSWVAAYRVTHTSVFNEAMRKFSGAVGENSNSYFTVSADGSIHSATSITKINNWVKKHGSTVGQVLADDKEASEHWGPGALSLLADMRFLWIVTASDTVDPDNDRKVSIRFGIDPDMVKSLLYARSEPVTETGRKRPILHWVESHKRRMQKGDDVDIAKHLRGVSSFTMGGLRFDITQPIKPQKQTALAA